MFGLGWILRLALVVYLTIGLILAIDLGGKPKKILFTILFWIFRHHDRHIVVHFFNQS